ncbi:MAG TPA: glycosyltransferase [Pseudolabrys sp.]|nr:glycosyltransferase [Pseudolabrys sp.]
MLIVAPRLDVGGAEQHLTRILPRLSAAGLPVSIFAMQAGGSLQAELAASGVNVRAAPPHKPATARVLNAAGALRREIRRLRPDIIHFFLPEPYLVGSLAAVGVPGTIKVMSRRSLADYQRNHPVLARLERHLHRSVAALIANSTAVAEQLMDESGAPRKVGIIRNGIDVPPIVSIEARAARRRELGIPDDCIVFAVVANLIPYKGHADLLSALGGLRGRMLKPWRLLAIGRDEGIGASLTKQALSLGLGDNILWLGERRDVPVLLSAADVGLLPSHQEGFSNALIEMMAAGLPVIATAVGGNLDAIVKGESGSLVPVRDPAALGQAIATLYDSAALRARLGAAARARVERLFSLDACVRRYVNLYSGLLERPDTPVAYLIDPPGRERVPEVQEEFHGTAE